MITENKTYLDPDKVYLPITDEDAKIASLQVEEGDTVKVGQIIANKYRGKKAIPVISTVSGEVKGVEQRINRFGKFVDHVIIDNDKKNTLEAFDTYDDEVPTQVIRNQLLRLGINQVTVDGLYTDISFEQPINHLMIDAVYTNEPFISLDYDCIVEQADEITDGILLLAKAAKAETVTLLVDKYMNQEALDELGKSISDTVIELEVVNSKKMNGSDYKIARKLIGQRPSINFLDDGIMYTSVFTTKSVYQAIRQGLPLTTRKVAMTGDAFITNALYDVRIGTLFSDLVEDLGGYNDTEALSCHIGNFLSGNQAESDEFSIDATINSVDVSRYREVEQDVCIKCGDCNDVCPADILPQNIMDAEIRSVGERIVELHTDDCIECGLCTFVCPSKINVLEWVRRAKRRVG